MPEAVANDDIAYLPLDVVDDRCIIVAVQIAGVRRNAVLDTGATITLVGSHLARELAMAAVGRRSLSGFADAGSADEVPNFEARFGTQAVAFNRPVSLDLTAISSAIGRTIDLIIGRDLFAEHVVDVDLPSGRWSVTPHSGAGTPPGSAAALTFGERGEPTLRIAVEGKTPCAAVLDLGASAALTMSREYATANDLLRAKRTSTAAFAGANGTFISTSVMIDTLDVGGERLRALPAEIIDQWVLPDAPAVLGLPALRRFRLVFDYRAGRAWISPDRGEVGKPFPEDHAGLGVARDGDRLVVRHVAAGSPAAIAGWREGEVILAVDGRPIAEVYADARMRQWRNRAPGTRIVLTVAGGAQRALVLSGYY